MLQKATNQNKLLHSKVFTLFWERERDERFQMEIKKKQRCYQVGWAVSGFDALNSLTHINPLTPMSDQDRISPYSGENKEIYQFGDN